MTTASVLNLINWNDITNDPLTKGVVENIKNCQTFEGGLGPEPYCEAHGGYSYCGIATLVLLNKLNYIDVNSFLRWLVNRQMTQEGGFNGRGELEKEHLFMRYKCSFSLYKKLCSFIKNLIINIKCDNIVLKTR